MRTRRYKSTLSLHEGGVGVAGGLLKMDRLPCARSCIAFARAESDFRHKTVFR